jgi:hypothetical protein
MRFTVLSANGDIFTAASLPVMKINERYLLSFDYLGLAQSGSVTGNLGGFIGLVDSGQNRHWLAGTDLSGLNTPVGIELADDGAWHHYEIDITAYVQDRGITSVRLVVEDWNTSGGVAGDVYFDNIKLLARGGGFTLEELVPCAGPTTGGAWRNHGQYVSAAMKAARGLFEQGSITRQEQRALISAASRSDCGKKK